MYRRYGVSTNITLYVDFAAKNSICIVDTLYMYQNILYRQSKYKLFLSKTNKMLYQQLEELIQKYHLETQDSEIVEQAIEILYKQKQRPTTKKAYSIRLNVDDMEKIKTEAKEQ
jgi:hypothetical protein